MSSLISVIAGSRRRFDPDALAYFSGITAAGSSITDGNKLAVDAFIKGCKTDGIWSAIKASCLLAGPDTLAGALVPLVGPTPTNVGPFEDADYDRTTGLIGNGTTKYLDSNRNNNTEPLNSQHIAAWSTTVDTTTSGNPAIIGCGVSADASHIGFNTLTSRYFVRSRSTTAIDTILPKTTGFHGLTRGSSSNVTYRIGGNTTTQNLPSVASLNSTIKVLSRGSTPHWNGRVSFYSIGENITLLLLANRVSTYMSSLT